MAVTRRQFLSLAGGSATGAVLFAACGVPEDELLVQAPVEMPEDLVEGFDIRYATLCRQCPTNEGIVVRVMGGRAKKVEGNVDYPINEGKHSARCEAALQDLYHPDRISAPLVRVGNRGAGQWEEISWTDALARVSNQIKNLDESQGVVLTTGPVSGHLGKVVDTFVGKLGARHVPYETIENTNLHAAVRHVFGQGVLPDFDIANAGYVLSFGADFLNTWLSPVRYAKAYGNFRQGDRERGKLVHVDSRFSMTGANADEWVYVKPGWEGHLALSIASEIESQGGGDSGAVANLTQGGVDLDEYAADRVSGLIGVEADRIKHIAEEFATHGPSLAIGGGATAAHTNGLFNLKAIYSLNHIVGNVGKPGGVILNPGPALSDLPESPATASFGQWQDLTTDIRGGKVGVLMVRGADPVYGLPDSAGFRRTLTDSRLGNFNVPLIVSFSNRMDDTTAVADIVLPEHSSFEDWGDDVPSPGPGYQTIGFQQPVVRPFFESRGVHLGSKSFPDVLISMAQTLGIDLGLAGATFKEVLEDGARRLFDADRGSVKANDFPSFWNGILARGGWWDTSARYTGSIPDPKPLPANPETPESGGSESDYRYALVPFSSASLGDGEGAHLPWMQAMPDPITTATWQTWVEINIRVAEELGIEEGDVVKITSEAGSIEALAYPHPGISPDVVSVPLGQGHTAGGRYSEGRGANVLSILAPLSDGETGALAWAATRVNLTKTGDWVRLPKFENSAPDLAVDEDQKVIELTQIDS